MQLHAKSHKEKHKGLVDSSKVKLAEVCFDVASSSRLVLMKPLHSFFANCAVHDWHSVMMQMHEAYKKLVAKVKATAQEKSSKAEMLEELRSKAQEHSRCLG